MINSKLSGKPGLVQTLASAQVAIEQLRDQGAASDQALEEIAGFIDDWAGRAV